MLDYKPQEELIALIQRQESELSKSHDENETLKTALADMQARIGAMALELASRQPLADSFVAPLVTVDTPEFRQLAANHAEAIATQFELIAHIDAHTARAVAAISENYQIVCEKNDRLRAFIDQMQSAAQPVAGELPPLPEPAFKRGRSYGFMKADAWDEEMVRAYGDKRAEHAFSATAEFIELPSLQPVQQPAVTPERLQNWIDLIHDNERSMGDRLQSLSSTFQLMLEGAPAAKYPPFAIREQKPAAVAHNKHCGCPNCCEPAAVVGQEPVKDLECDDIDFCAFENTLRNMEWISKGLYPGKDHDLDGSFVSANIGHAKKLVNAVLPRMEAAYAALITAVRDGRRERRTAPVPAAGVQGDTGDTLILKAQLQAVITERDANRRQLMQYKREADALWKRVHKAEAASVQPDSGRDAALRSSHVKWDGNGIPPDGAHVRYAADFHDGTRGGTAVVLGSGYEHTDMGESSVSIEDISTGDRFIVDAEDCKPALAAHPANGAQAGDAALLGALTNVLDEYDRNTCTHENTKRGGAIWTICEDCGQKWADDRGGFKPYKDSAKIARARAILAAAKKADAPQKKEG